MNRESLQAQVVVAYDQGPEAIVRVIATLLSELSARVRALEEENAALRAKLAITSHNSSTPPSADGPGRKPHPKSLRERTGRPSGGQVGHDGHTLRLVDTPDDVQVHAASNCPQCGAGLEGAAVVRQERRQVVDVQITRLVSEHQVQTKCCPQVTT